MRHIGRPSFKLSMRPLQIINKLLAPLRLEMVRKPMAPKVKPMQRLKPGDPVKLYVGSGEDVKEGYLGVDLRKLPSVAIVCKAWEVSYHIQEVDEIYTRHMVEHLTIAESMATLKDWHKALKKGGLLHIVVPDLDFHIEQWKQAVWTEEAMKEVTSDAVHSRAGFFGWQRECDPNSGQYNTTYWDVHKSGYNKQYMHFLLTHIGFSNVKVETQDGCHLVAKAIK